MENNKFKLTKEKVAVFKQEEKTNALPVYFAEGVEFMGTGISINKFGEIMGCCSESLIKECKANPTIELIIWDCTRRFLLDDMGDGGEIAKQAKVHLHEGIPFRCVYETPAVSEGEIIFGVEEEGHPENPRFIYAMLPSEEKRIEEWYERHPEEKVERFHKHYAMCYSH